MMVKKSKQKLPEADRAAERKRKTEVAMAKASEAYRIQQQNRKYREAAPKKENANRDRSNTGTTAASSVSSRSESSAKSSSFFNSLKSGIQSITSYFGQGSKPNDTQEVGNVNTIKTTTKQGSKKQNGNGEILQNASTTNTLTAQSTPKPKGKTSARTTGRQ